MGSEMCIRDRLCLDHASQMWDYEDLFDDWNNLQRRIRHLFRTEEKGSGMILEKLERRSVAEASNGSFPISFGVFKGNYGPLYRQQHWGTYPLIELISLQLPESGAKGVKGVKLTGDSNVPFGETSFEIIDDRPLILPPDVRGSYSDLSSYLDNPEFSTAAQDLNVSKIIMYI